MPNGHDKNHRRLVMMVASHFARFGEWPHRLVLDPIVLVDLVYLYGDPQFLQLTRRVEILTMQDGGLAAESVSGRTAYGDSTGTDRDREAAEGWIRCVPRDDATLDRAYADATESRAGLDDEARRLLRVLVQFLSSGAVDSERPDTFLSYSGALRLLGHAPGPYAGRSLQKHGLTKLNEWTKEQGLPRITGLIVDKERHEPGAGFASSNGFHEDDNWRPWWKGEVRRAMRWDWAPYL